MRTGIDGRDKLVLALLVTALCVCLSATASAAAEPGAGTAVQAAAAGGDTVRLDVALAIGMAIGLPSLAAGYAVAKVGAAALGAAAEKPELLTRSLMFVALGEGIAVFGFLVALLLTMNWVKGVL